MSDADTEMARIWREVRLYEPYRKYAMCMQPACENCLNRQVQLISHDDVGADFKCRHCRHTFRKLYK